MILLAGGAWALFSGGGDEPPGPADPGSLGPSASRGPVTASVLVLRGATEPLVAVVASGPAPTVVVVPPDLSILIPARGDADTTALAGLGGQEVRTATSNLLGIWIDHYAITDLDHLASYVERSGGLDIALPGGATTMTGDQLKAYMAVSGPNLLTRWEILLPALVDGPLTFEDTDFIESDGASELTVALQGAGGARVQELPSHVVTTGVSAPTFEEIDQLAATAFGADSPPVPVVLENGSGFPGIGEPAAQALVPAGFRIVVSQNGDTFGLAQTQVLADGNEHVADAQRAVEALGVGAVAVSRVPSGIADVTIVLGKDFSS